MNTMHSNFNGMSNTKNICIDNIINEIRKQRACEVLPDKKETEVFKAMSTRGFSLIRLTGKVPTETGWQKACTTRSEYDPKRFNGFNVGIACGPGSGVIVWDVDDFTKVGSYLKERGLDLPNTFTVTTGRDEPAAHFYFQYPRDGKRYGCTSQKPNGFDVKGHGGQVVCPGSIHPGTGRRYKILFDLPIAPAPQWLLDLSSNTQSLRQETKRESIVLDTLNIPKSIKDIILNPPPKNDRSEAEMSVINSMVAHGYGYEQILSIMEQYPIGEKHREAGSRRFNRLQNEVEKAKIFIGGEPPATWGPPEPLINSIPDAPRMPLDCFPGVIADFCKDVAERMQVTIDSVVVPMLVTIAGCIGKDALMFPRAKGDWKERVCLWCCLILPPGKKKSPVIDVATKPLGIIQNRYAKEHQKQIEEWDKLCSAAKQRHKAWEKECQNLLKDDPDAMLPDDPMIDLPPKPTQKRTETTDSTIEKLVDLMNRSPGLTQVSDELAGFLLNMNRYSTGSDRQFYLKCKTGGGHTVDRIGRGEEYVDDLYLNIIGGIQPKVAKELFSPKAGAADDGFFERFGLMIYPAPMTTYDHIDRYPDRAARDAYYKICETLSSSNWSDVLNTDEYHPGKGIARFDSQAQEAFNRWDVKHGRAMLAADEDESINTMLSKAPGLLVQLALLFHLSDWASGVCVDVPFVGLRSFERAERFLNEYLIPMWKRILAAFADDGGDSAAKKIGKWLVQDKIKVFTIRDIKRKHWSNLKKDDEIEVPIVVLIEKKWIKETGKRSTGGRSTINYIVNPAIYEMA